MIEGMDVEAHATPAQVWDFMFRDDFRDCDVVASRHESCEQLAELEVVLKHAPHKRIVHQAEVLDELDVFFAPPVAFFFCHVRCHGVHLLRRCENLLGFILNRFFHFFK